MLSPDGKTLYLDENRYTPAEDPQPVPRDVQAGSEAEIFRREGAEFLEYLRRSTGKLGAGTDEELAQMRPHLRGDPGLCEQPPGADAAGAAFP